MTVKIDGTNGIDTAQLRAPDGDPVAMTVGNDGKVTFPAVIPQAPGLVIDNGAADGGNLTLKSLGAQDWGMDSADGVLRLINVGVPGQLGMTIDAAGKVAFPAMGQLLSSNGYVKLPGGLIIQWGNINTAAGVAALTFPIPFPNAVFQVLGVCAVTANIVCVVQSQSVNGASLLSHIGSTGAGATTPVRWIAIGY